MPGEKCSCFFPTSSMGIFFFFLYIALSVCITVSCSFLILIFRSKLRPWYWPGHVKSLLFKAQTVTSWMLQHWTQPVWAAGLSDTGVNRASFINNFYTPPLVSCLLCLEFSSLGNRWMTQVRASRDFNTRCSDSVKTKKMFCVVYLNC